MGRLSNRDKYFHFDISAYKKALGRKLSSAVVKGSELLYQELAKNITALSPKTTPVRLGDGTFTNDAERMVALLNSLAVTEVAREAHRVKRVVSAMNDGSWQDSHVGVYYEYGTGNQQVGGERFYRLETPNQFRDGRDIVTRSRYQYFDTVRKHAEAKGSAEGLMGKWYDIGGNVRTTFYKKGGVRDDEFLAKGYGEVEPEFWYAKAVENCRPKIRELIQEAVLSVHPGKFILYKDKITLGGGR